MLTTNREALSREEFSLAEFIWILRAHAGWVLGIPLVLSLVTLVNQLLTPRQWEASVAIKMGQVGTVAATGPSSEYIEPLSRAIERMRLRAFQDGVLADLGISTDEKDRNAVVYRRSLRIRQPENSDVIEVRVRGFSADQAKQLAEATVKHLRDVHVQLAQPSIDRLKRQLVEVRQEMERVQAEQQRLVLKIEGRNQAGVGFSERLLFDNMVYQLGVQRRELELRALAYEENLGPLRTWETAALDKAFVGNRPEPRQTPLRVGLAGLIGLCLGGFVALAIHALRATPAAGAKGFGNPAS